MNRGDSEIDLHKSMMYLGQRALPTAHGEFAVHFFRDLTRNQNAMAIACGSLTDASPLLARVHSSCLTSECLMGLDCDCAEQLDGALATMAEAGSGVLFYLMQEGRGAGLTAKARDRMIVQASGNRVTTFEAYAEMGLPSDLRSYDAVAPMSKLLGIRGPLCLLTNNPDKAAAVAKVLAEERIEVGRTEAIHGPISVFNSDYLSAKHESGHSLNHPARIEAEMPPQRVQLLPPIAVPGAAHLVRTAAYLLPIALPKPGATMTATPNASTIVEWFTLAVVLDRRTGHESIVLAHRSSGQADLMASAQALLETNENPRQVTMDLLDRLPIASSPGREALIRSLMALCAEGRGAVSVRFDDRDRAEH